jgi:antitoxin (DNA-binding transcriptional repressor) of toxin-antitoxin stability system
MLFMKAVGIRELKNRLSEYIRLVKSGEDILVTDRGQVVAELRAPSQSPLISQYPGLNDLVRQGKVRLGAPNDPSLYPRLKKLLEHEEVMRLLDEERGEH